MTTIELSANGQPSHDGRAQRDQLIVGMLQPGEEIWLVDEQYDSALLFWRFDLLRRGPHGTWMRQRYQYDAVASIVHFRGERPVPTNELTKLRRSGTRMVGG